MGTYGNVTSIDIDENCKMVGEKLYKNVSFETKDIINYNTEKYDVIACTSCEHLTQTDFNKVFNNIKHFFNHLFSFYNFYNYSLYTQRQY